MTRENAPIVNPDFRDGASLNGIPLATRFDLAEMKRNWNQALPDKVLELALNGGVTSGGAAAGGSLDNLATRIGMKHAMQACFVSQIMDGNTFDLLPGGFTFPGGTDDAIGNVIQADLEAPLFIRAYGPKITHRDVNGTPNAFDQTYNCLLDLHWNWTVTANRQLSLSCNWKYWLDVAAATFFQATGALLALRKELWMDNRYVPILAPTETGTFSSATLTADMKTKLGTVSGDWAHYASNATTRTSGGGRDGAETTITTYHTTLVNESQEWFNNLVFPIDYLVLAAR